MPYSSSSSSTSTTNFVPIDQIFNKFQVIFCNEQQRAVQQLDGVQSAFDMYVCRYKIVHADGKYCLVPRAAQQRPVLLNVTPPRADKENDRNNITKQSSPSKRKCLVTPIKIVNKSVQKVARHATTTTVAAEEEAAVDSDTAAVSPQKRSKRESSGRRLAAAAAVKPSTPSSRASNACRNLSMSLNNEQLNYSIEQQDELKIKLTVSATQPAAPSPAQNRRKSMYREKIQPEDEPIVVEDSPAAAAASPMKPAARRMTRSKSIMMISNEELTPLKTALRNVTMRPQQPPTTPKSVGTPRKSILKTPSSRAAAATVGKFAIFYIYLSKTNDK